MNVHSIRHLPSPECDVVVIGGGPAGAATAIALARTRRSIVVIEKSRYEQPRIGETLPPAARPLLVELTVWESFLGAGHLSSPGVLSAWGDEELYRDSLHLQSLRARLASRSATIRCHVGACRAAVRRIPLSRRPSHLVPAARRPWLAGRVHIRRRLCGAAASNPRQTLGGCHGTRGGAGAPTRGQAAQRRSAGRTRRSAGRSPRERP